MTLTALHIAVVGAGPVGLALALHAARTLPHARITLFDARPAGADVSADPRTLALSLGSVQLLQRLGAWPTEAAQPISEVHVSQAAPSLLAPLDEPVVHITAAEQRVPLLGAVLAYGALVARLQAAWEGEAAAAPERLRTRFGTPVAALKAMPAGVEVDAGIAEAFDLAVVAEGGVFAEQSHKPVTHDYRQTAWVGTVTLAGGTPGMAFERFTRHGPAALLPLRPGADGSRRAALVWCVASGDDPVRDLDEAQRLAVLATIFPEAAGRLTALSPLKAFPLGLNAERTLVGGGSGDALPDADGGSSGWPSLGAFRIGFSRRSPGRVVRIGNAAQTLHPVAGQGLNLGLRDAHALVAALRFATDVDAALQRVEWARAPDRWATILTTDFLARSFTWQAPAIGTLRGLGLAALQAAPPLKGWLARRMMFGAR